MCGRYLLKATDDDLRRLFGYVEHPNLAPRYNIAPTQDAPVMRQRREPAGERTLANLRWGLIPPSAVDPKKGPPQINARGESLLEKRSFAAAFRRRRCLVPADGFYEWREGDPSKQPFLVERRDGASVAFAGIWERWGPRHDPQAAIDSFAIITTAANDFLRPLHPRMPVILQPENFARWLDPDGEAESLNDLLVPAANDLLRVVPLGRAVNAARAEGPELIVPIGPEMIWSGG